MSDMARRAIDLAERFRMVAPDRAQAARDRLAENSDPTAQELAAWLGLTEEAARMLRSSLEDPPTVAGAPMAGLARLALEEPLPAPTLGPYEILAEIGRGGMGVVYRARDPRLGREVALKVLVAGSDAPPALVERFRREASLAARMGAHPYIVPVYDTGQEGARHWFTMDLVEGTTLRAWAAKQRAPRETLELARKVVIAIAHAHSRGVVHRDLKPDNVLVDATGDPHVTDFGLARDLGDATRISHTGQVLGTPAYMAPEQADGRVKDVGPQTDVYAFGALLYELFARRPPFVRETVPACLHAILFEEPEPLRRLAPDAPAGVEAITARCLEKDSRRRYRDASEVVAELDRCLAGESPLARPPTVISRAWRRVVRRPAFLIVGISLGVAAGLYVRSLRREADAEVLVAKARCVSNVVARWNALLPAIEEMEAHRYDTWASEDERRAGARARWAEIEGFLRDTPGDGTSQAVARSLGGWARGLLGEDPTATIEEASRLDPEVPHGPLLLAFVSFSRFIDMQPMPEWRIESGGMVIENVPPEPPGRVALAREIEKLLTLAAGARLWGRESSADLAAALSGVRAISEGRLAEAEDALSRAIASPDLQVLASWLRYARAIVRYLRKRFEEALEDLDFVARRRPRAADVARWRGIGLWALARGEAAHDEHARALLRDAAREFKAARAHRERALVLLRLVLALVESDLDPREAIEEAKDAFAHAIETSPEDWVLRETRGLFHCTVAAWRAHQGESAETEFRQSIEDYGAAIEGDGTRASAWAARGFAWMQLGDASTGSKREAYECAARDAAKAFAMAPSEVSWGVLEGFARFALADTLLEAGEDARAELRVAIRRFELSNDANLATNRAVAILSLAEQEARIGTEAADLFQKANALYEELLAGAPDNGGLRVDAARAAASWLSNGGAATLRDDAFRYLKDARRLGAAGAAELTREPRFAVLRDDPRWAELVPR